MGLTKKNGRLFTFGCSLTRYHWPTWADILGQSYQEFYNWANRGAGNRQIMERFSEACLRHDFTTEDTVIIQWTDYHRFDSHKSDPDLPESWYPGGNIFVDNAADSTKGFVMNKLWDERSYMMHTFNSIHAAIGIARVGCKARVIMVFGNDMREDLVKDPYWAPYKKILQNNYWIDKDMYNWMVQHHDKRLKFKGAKMGNLDEEPTMDYHPTPMMYYEWLQKFISPMLGVGIDKQFASKYQTVLEKTNDYKDIGKAILEAGYDTNKRYARGY